MIHAYLAGNLVCLTTVKSYTHFFTVINLIIFFRGGGGGLKLSLLTFNLFDNLIYIIHLNKWAAKKLVRS